ncbi:MAG: sodium-translocating pyrophosphatase [Clostridiales Family XIII bacterium]|jgi:K(+)-stimulated pyrophosphate-energized sodium pump|nr:sodium-translocating pyrophosphatase [Clostridiales Family XIII bacterium]
MKKIVIVSVFLLFLLPQVAYASEADLIIPNFAPEQHYLLLAGIAVCIAGFIFGLIQYTRIKKIRAHKSMLDVANTIYETCKTYLLQQGKFLGILLAFIGVCIVFYFGVLDKMPVGNVVIILAWAVIGILGSYAIAWYGIRMNTVANSRMAFASLENKPLKLLNIPLNAGISIGVLLICTELIMMLIILLFLPRDIAGACFIGFAIGESLGASALRIAGGIFTKIADIGSDLMKIVFKIEEDDPRNPGVIADCTGDNAGDSVGPTADGFETYGVTGVALISFIVLAAVPDIQADLLTWIFVMRILMIITSVFSFYINNAITRARFGGAKDLDFEKPLTSLVWITSLLSIAVTFVVSYALIGPSSPVGAHGDTLWLWLSVIISCGTIGGAVIPEFTKIFTSPSSKHVNEIVNTSKEGGPSLNILSGLIAGNFSAFWLGMVFFVLMFVAYLAGGQGLSEIMTYESIFSFGLVAFGFLGMGPVTIAVDSYGPVTDNAQSIYELSLIEKQENINEEIEKNYGFKPNFDTAKYFLEANDGAGNTFKATAKPVLIGTAVVGATTMIFSLILVIGKTTGVDPALILNLLNPFTILGFICGGATIFWFSGASTQAVCTGAYKAVEYIKRNIVLDETADMKASIEKSKEVVKICTQYAQRGMLNIFIAVFCFTLAYAFFSAPGNSTEPLSFFISYLISIAVIGLFQAIFMANAGGGWDNAKKVVEVNLKMKGTELHDATIVGDTVGDPFKDTTSVALNPIIKFTTLFGMLAMEIAITDAFTKSAPIVGVIFFIIAIVFVWRSFYTMRIRKTDDEKVGDEKAA